MITTDPEKDSPKLTVGLPVYNGEKYLDETLHSLLAQSDQDFIVLISDNASTDGTPEILAQWRKKDSRIRVFRQKTNIGAQGNFKWLADQAVTPWFMFAAHDDKWSPNYIEALLCKADSVPNCELVLPRVTYFYEDSTPPTHRDMDEKMFLLTGTRRIRTLLRAATGTWIYGLHRTQSIQNAFSSISTYPYTWGFDMILILSIILRGNISGTKNADFNHLETTVSRDHYRPKTSREQFALADAFRRTALATFRREIPDAGERAKLFLPVLAYADRNGFKIRRAIKNFLKESCRRSA